MMCIPYSNNKQGKEKEPPARFELATCGLQVKTKIKKSVRNIDGFGPIYKVQK